MRSGWAHGLQINEGCFTLQLGYCAPFSTIHWAGVPETMGYHDTKMPPATGERQGHAWSQVLFRKTNPTTHHVCELLIEGFCSHRYRGQSIFFNSILINFRTKLYFD